jgi:hypothetical protein
MLLFDGFFGIVAFGVWLFCIIDVITQPDAQIRNLPKLVWLILVVLLLDVGSIAWLVAGRPWPSSRTSNRAGGRPGERLAPPQRAGQPQRSDSPTAPDDDPQFLAQLRARAEEQRRRAREATEGEDPPDRP